MSNYFANMDIKIVYDYDYCGDNCQFCDCDGYCYLFKDSLEPKGDGRSIRCNECKERTKPA